MYRIVIHLWQYDTYRQPIHSPLLHPLTRKAIWTSAQNCATEKMPLAATVSWPCPDQQENISIVSASGSPGQTMYNMSLRKKGFSTGAPPWTSYSISPHTIYQPPPTEGESPSPYLLWCPPNPRVQFAITSGANGSPASCSWLYSISLRFMVFCALPLI